jgi:O-antigen ligase
MSLLHSNNFFFNLSKLLIILLPGLLITGPFLPDLAISTISIIFILYSVKTTQYKFFNNNFFKIFIIFYLWTVICSVLSNNILYSLKTSIPYLRFGIFSIALFFFLEKDKKLKKKIFFSLSFFFLILIFDSFFQYFTNFNILGFPLYEDGRVSSFFGKELILGSYFSRLLPLFLALYFINKNFLNRNKILDYISIIIFSLSIVCIYFSAERSSVLFFFISFFLLFFLVSKNKHIILFGLGVMFFIFLISYINQDKNYKRLVNHSIHQFETIKTNKEKNIFYYVPENYQDLYFTAFKMFDNNKIFGIGPKMYRNECIKKEYNSGILSCSTHPHNTYLQLLAEVGLFGFFVIFSFFLIIIFYLTKYYLLSLKKKKIFTDPQLCFFSMILITLWPLVPTGNFFGNWLNIIYYLPFGFILNSLNNRKI